MPKVTINVKSYSAPGEQESHYGYICTVGPERQLFADVPDDLIQIELEHGRVTLVDAGTAVGDTFDPATSEDLEALKAYATSNGITFHHASGVAKIREAIIAAKG